MPVRWGDWCRLRGDEHQAQWLVVDVDDDSTLITIACRLSLGGFREIVVQRSDVVRIRVSRTSRDKPE